jgi:hypothetical protein
MSEDIVIDVSVLDDIEVLTRLQDKICGDDQEKRLQFAMNVLVLKWYSMNHPDAEVVSISTPRQ